MRLYFFIFFILVSVSQGYSKSNIIKDGKSYYFADRIVVKYQNIPFQNSTNLKNFYAKFGIKEKQKTLSKISYNENSDFDKIFTLKFDSPYNPVYMAKEIRKLKEIEWAEPHYLYELTYVPNDPVYNGSDNAKYEHLKIINAESAWDINRGSEDIIIAIVDTGVDWDHPDLADNIWINNDEIANNGIDDDNNGYIDDIRGWDFGRNESTADNNPNEDNDDHGTHVAGLASAVSDNAIGIASIGFNSKLMAVKTSSDDLRNDEGTALVATGYEGIKYAADNGADIINCSWGGYNYSYYAQSVVSYAISKGSMIVAASGNDNSTDSFYPASYEGVLSVAATTFDDVKASWSNYGTNVDVSSPGLNIYSTWFDDSYISISGTSMASPIAAGLAAIVSSQYPGYSPLQIAEQIRVNSDNIYTLNSSYQNKLGYGRINALKALSNSNAKSVRISDITFIEVGDNDGIYEAGENVKINLELTNYLNPLSNLRITLATENSNVELIGNNTSLGSVSTLQSISIDSDQFELRIKPDSDTDVELEILVTFEDTDYLDYDWITLSINPTYQIHTTENLSVTYNSSGSIGFDDYPTNLKGNGLIYKDGPNLMFEGALIYGTSSNTIVNSARDVDGNKDKDFSVLTPIVLKSPGSFADKESYAKFNDAFATPTSLGIETEVYTYSFSSESDADYIIIRYSFNNTTTEIIQNFYAGQYWDFDMDATSYDDDMVGYHNESAFGYIYDNDGDPVSTYIGLTLLSEGNIGFFAMNNNGHVNPVISWDGFSDEEKWTALTSGLNYKSSTQSDISVLISSGPNTLNPNSKTEIDFLIAAGDNLESLSSNIESARIKYQEIPTSILHDNEIPLSFNLEQNYPNPFNPNTVIKYSIPSYDRSFIEGQNVTLKIFDILGKEVATLVNEYQKPGNYEIKFNADFLPSGVYLYRLKSNQYNAIKKMLLLK